jgi:Flp pilus assembly protein TadD
MSSVNSQWRSIALAALCAGAAGCASRPDAASPPRDAAGPATTVAAAPARTPRDGAVEAPAPATQVPAAAARPDNPAQVPPAAVRAFDEALRALRAGRVDDAERSFKALAQSHPELGGPHANLGLIHRQAGRLPEAVAALEKAVQASPRQPAYFNQLGIAYRQHGRFAQARAAYEQAIALDADYAAPYLNLGILHDLYLHDRVLALDLYDRYLALSPGGDATVAKWVVDLKNRKGDRVMLSKKEQE